MESDPSAARLKRRALLRAGLGSALAAPAIIASHRAFGAGVVNVMTYDGMIPPDFKKQFEADTGIEIRLRLVDDQGKQFNLMAAEAPHPLSDIVTIAGHRIHQFVESQLLAPLDIKRLTNWGHIDPHYSSSSSVLVGGQVFGVPLLTGAEVMIYNTSQVKNPDSWAVMFDPKYRGNTTYVVEDFLSCTLLYLGYDGTFASYVNDEAKAARAVAAARDLLIRNKPQVRKYYQSGAELQQMLVNDDVVLAQGYAGTLAKMILAGEPIRFAIPKEGSFAFFYNFNLASNAANPDNAYKLMNALLADPKVGAAMTRSAGYISTLTGADASLTARERQAFSLTPAEVSRLTFFRYEGQKLSSKLLEPAVEQVEAA